MEKIESKRTSKTSWLVRRQGATRGTAVILHEERLYNRWEIIDAGQRRIAATIKQAFAVAYAHEQAKIGGAS